MKLMATVWREHVRGGQVFSPEGFVVRAVAIAVLFLVCHLLGLRQYTTIASGSAPPSLGSESVGAALGVIYIAAYFGFVVLAPILLIGAGLFALWRIALRKGRVGPPTVGAETDSPGPGAPHAGHVTDAPLPS